MKPVSLSESDKEKIKKEVKKVISTLIRGCEALDMDMAFRAYSDSPDFLMIGMDGSLCDYQTFIRNNKEYLTTCSDFKLITMKEIITILHRDEVLFSLIYKAEATQKTGEKDIFNKAGASFLLRKINHEWKVIYYHESGFPPDRISGNK